MNSCRYILGLSMALGLSGCGKNPSKAQISKVVDDLTRTCLAVEESKAPCGYRRGDSPQMSGGMCLSYPGLKQVNQILQEKTDCRLLVFQRIENGTLDYLVQRKSCDLATTHPNSDLLKDYKKIYP